MVPIPVLAEDNKQILVSFSDCLFLVQKEKTSVEQAPTNMKFNITDKHQIQSRASLTKVQQTVLQTYQDAQKLLQAAVNHTQTGRLQVIHIQLSYLTCCLMTPA